LRAFEDANGRRATPAERQLLRGLADRFDAPAAEQARPGRETGWEWLAAAVYEAVEAGSAYVAPRRLREILTRWEWEGLPGDDGRRPERDRPAGSGRSRSRRAPAGDGAPSPQSSSPSPDCELAAAEDIPLPHGFGSRRTWEFTASLLSGALDPEPLRALLRGTAIAGYQAGEITILAPDSQQAQRIAGEYRELIARKLGEAMRRPVQERLLITV